MPRPNFPLATLVLLASAALVCPLFGAAAQRRRAPARRGTPRQARPRVDFSIFSHRTPQHRQRACDSCHQSPSPDWARVRERGAAFPDITDYPGHASCLDCHRRQFFTGARPAICSICHTVVSPRAGARHPFQNPSELFDAQTKKPKRPSDFVANFPHGRHQDVMARAPAGGAGFVRASFARQGAEKAIDSCAVCHQTYQPQGGETESEYVTPPPSDLGENELHIPAFWLKKGMLKTTPTGHASCFSCHWQEGGERPLSSDCAGCHTPAPAPTPAPSPTPADADAAHPSLKGLTDAEVFEHWKERRVARFRHQQEEHQKVGCTACHVTITSVNRLGPETLAVPIQTCASSSCHGATRPTRNIIFQEVERRRKPEGANYQCAKCHLNYGREPTPKTHSDLFPAK